MPHLTVIEEIYQALHLVFYFLLEMYVINNQCIRLTYPLYYG
jgi:hypothetical protein